MADRPDRGSFTALFEQLTKAAEEGRIDKHAYIQFGVHLDEFVPFTQLSGAADVWDIKVDGEEKTRGRSGEEALTRLVEET